MAPISSDPVVVEIIRQRLLSITDQIEANLTRTAYSPLIYEYKDYCVVLLDAECRIIAQSRGSIPIFLADIGGPVREGVDMYGPGGLEPGDVVITNYPGTSGQHLNNVVMFTSVFAGGRIAGYMAIRAHWADVGGRYVGSASSNDTTDIFQEGIQIRSVKLRRRGEPVPEIYRIIEDNTRFPHMVLGDVEAQLAGCVLGRDLFADMVGAYGIETIEAAIRRIWDQTEAQARAAVRSMPDGVYEASSFLDNDGVDLDRPIPIHAVVRVEGDEMTVDLTDIADQVRGPFNSGRFGGGITAARVAFKYVTTVNEAANEGSFRNLQVILPDGKFLSASRTAAMARYSTPLPTVVDTIIKALAPAIPDRVVAGHHASMGAYMFVGRQRDTGQLFKHQDTAHGGWGGSRGKDGAGPFKTVAHGDTLDIPVEVQEALYPLQVDAYEFRPDSGGAGQRRGGLGLDKTYTVLEPAELTVVFERSGCPPWGLAGGGAAESGHVLLEVPGQERQRVQKVSSIPLPAGSRVWIRSGGGGGFGSPYERAVRDVLKDVQRGFVTREGAARDYGVIVDVSGALDEEQTARRRAVKEGDS